MPKDKQPITDSNQAWEQLATRSFLPHGNALVFMHEMETPSGTRWLVVLEGLVMSTDIPSDERDPADPHSRIFGIELITNYLLTFNGRMAEGSNARGDGAHLGYGERLTVYRGRSDPSDPSHFTIKYAIDGKTAHIDGWLTDDPYERIKLKVREDEAAAAGIAR